MNLQSGGIGFYRRDRALSSRGYLRLCLGGSVRRVTFSFLAKTESYQSALGQTGYSEREMSGMSKKCLQLYQILLVSRYSQ